MTQGAYIVRVTPAGDEGSTRIDCIVLSPVPTSVRETTWGRIKRIYAVRP